VASEGNTPRQVRGISDSSRLGRIIEISDLSKEDTLKYLDFLKVEFDKAKIYDLAGGRLVLLNNIIQNLNRGQVYEDIRRDLIGTVRQEFYNSKVLPLTTPERRKNWEGIVALAKSPDRVMPFDAFMEQVPQADLLDGNIFAYHPSEQTISFQSRPVELFVEQKINRDEE